MGLVIQEYSNFRKENARKEEKVITKYLDERLVSFLEEEEKFSAIDSLVNLLDVQEKLKEKEVFRSAILEREKIVSTGIGIGVAIPHAKIPGCPGFFIAIGIQKGVGIDWNALDGSLVRLIFMIGGPDNKQTEYLKILSQLTQVIKDEQCRKKLLQCSRSKEVIELFASF